MQRPLGGVPRDPDLRLGSLAFPLESFASIRLSRNIRAS